ncbi:hypothetical protein JK358_37335 [Nocardia sp. 2]|uniref:TrbL/VirB6 plasmid conjugal transfer protein n=1 Tax=Nocardia acididurans TaxID=2802282 RepID=A0ABS1MIH8_9NOCA|nr:hypothetical protein [Nocardia acididurans]MBL1080076.1 hypothetical protein [Nocardia acididurans]
MVTPVRLLRTLLTGLAVVLTAVVLTAAPAGAAPEENGGGTYGFHEACEQANDALDSVGIPGLPSLGDVLGTACKIGHAVTHPADAVDAIQNKAWSSTFGKAVESLLEGLGDALILSLTWWTRIPTTIASTDLFSEIRSYTFQLQIICLTGSLIACAIRLAMAHRSGAAEQATETTRTLGRAIFASAMFSTILTLGTQGGDRFAEWVIDESTGHNARGVAEAMLHTSVLTAFSPGLVFIVALLGLLGAVMQAVFALVREALLVVVVGVLPLAAASSGTHIGRGFHDRLLAWSIAFVLYKPVAALIYMIAFTTAGRSGRDFTATVESGQAPTTEQAQQVLVGVVLLCSAALVLPALMRLVTPLANIGGGISGAVAAGGVLGAAASAMVSRGTGVRGGPTSVNTSRSGGNGGGGGGNSATGARPAPPPPAPRGGSSAGASGGGGGRGASGATSAKTASTGRAMTAVKGAGPVGAAAAVAVQSSGSVMRGGASMVESAAAPVARPTGAGRGAVPR